MANARKTYKVISPTGLNVRKRPAMNAPIVRVLACDAKVTIDKSTEAPDGWIAIVGGGFVVAKYLK